MPLAQTAPIATPVPAGGTRQDNVFVLNHKNHEEMAVLLNFWEPPGSFLCHRRVFIGIWLFYTELVCEWKP